MKTFSVPTKNEVNAESQQIFDSLKGQIGMVPNIYAFAGYSSAALNAQLSFGQALSKGSLSGKELEVVALATSAVNQCDYCRAAHTAIGKMQGLSDEQTLQARAAALADPKLDALAKLARSITQNRGRAESQVVDAFFRAGYTEQALVEVVAQVSHLTFTNYLHNLTHIPVDFPAAPALQTA
ncbi:MAG: carboxymuconolactone decarboxylase family protein [Sphingobacteriia bacterium]|jgi:uncharacterized peroxidase-related enzyme